MEFVRYNANPKNRKTGDCVIRAICTALNNTWEQTYRDMLEVAIKTGYAISHKDNYAKYLLNKGYEMQKQPRKSDGTKYTVQEFVDKLAEPNKTYILNLANHVTLVIDEVVYDIWNCKTLCVGNYWVLDTISKPKVKIEL